MSESPTTATASLGRADRWAVLGPEELRRYLLEDLLPLWRERGVDRRHGGFHNRLTRELEPAPDDHKRLVSQTRQIYAFTHAALLGAPEWADRAAADGLQFLWDRYWDRSRGGFHFTVTPEGAPLDRRKDTYAHAFVLFSLAWVYKRTGDSTALEIAERTSDLLDRHLADPIEGGFFECADAEWRRADQMRRQNPHMHLLEAYMALYEATADARWREAGSRIVTLFRDRLFDHRVGCLREYFTPDWEPHPGPEGSVVEPGHHFEWVWLLHRFAAACGGGSVAPEAARLFEFGLRHGISPQTGGVVDELDVAGEVIRPTQRVWPQTEFLKALAVRLETGLDAGAEQRLRDELARCLRERVQAHGGWEEQLSADGRPVVDAMPATSVYHIVLALSEVARVLGETP